MSDVIEIDDLHKSYGDLPVLQGLSLRVAAGEAFGLLGPNGSGKSTLIHLMLGFLRPNSGRIRLLGSPNLDRTRPRVGYIPERQRYHTRYTAREYLRFLGQFSGLGGGALSDRVDAELRAVGLDEAADRSLGTFSKGMLQRLGVAQALLMDPDLLLIDEPTSGLDPAGQREVLELLNEVRVRGHTVFLCTHYLHEVELLCDRVGVLAGGRIATEATVGDLRGVPSSVRIHVGALSPELRAQLADLGPAVHCDAQNVRISPNAPALQEAVLRALLDAGVLILALEPIESPLERLYLQAVRGAPPADGQPAPPPQPGDGPPPREAGPWATAAPHAPASARPRRGQGDTLLNELLGRREDRAPGEAGQEER
ncbi:MAG TPA: ABC transporter ATP-binding protein [Chloroflexaceae bacterium]|nr:ABC transporter ATP-binding protein [Chloroflexaceae bacterium]